VLSERSKCGGARQALKDMPKVRPMEHFGVYSNLMLRRQRIDCGKQVGKLWKIVRMKDFA
jgi:hypothetical protein